MPGVNKWSPFLKRIWLPILLTIFIGLAPFGEEPHLVGKIRWIMGGAVGMKTIDWLDLLFHLSPFIYLLVTILTIRRVKT